nr:peptidyl-prolyl cis-trans isomerase D-like isoform X1 [Onthophagus taurus]
MDNENNSIVYLDIQIGNERAGRIIIELFDQLVPKAAANFKALCTGEKGIGEYGKKLHYKGNTFHRVVPQFMVQGGDIINCDGTGGESIYGPSFEDENFTIMHDNKGTVGMANQGPNTNGSQFYITTVPCHHLDGLNVAIGRVKKGLGIVEEMQQLPRENEVPLKKCMIVDCGVIKNGEPLNIEENDGTEDVYPPYPEDWDVESKDVDKEYKNAVNHIKNSGNAYYYKCDYVHSERKYKKSLRYLEAWLKRHKKQNHPKVTELKSILLINIAAVLLKKKEYRETIKICTQVLSIDPKNVKALMRRGCAKLGIKDYNDAIRDFRHILALDPKNKTALVNFQVAKQCMLDYTKREQELFSKMF